MMIVMMVKKMQESDTENEVHVCDYGQDGDDHDHDDGDDDDGDYDNEDDIQVREAYRVFDKERVGHITASELRSTFLSLLYFTPPGYHPIPSHPNHLLLTVQPEMQKAARAR